METRFLDFARSPESSGRMMWEDHVIMTCVLPICQAQLFVAKAHYNIWTLEIAPGGSWWASQLTGKELLT
jgi:hypothetical protein